MYNTSTLIRALLSRINELEARLSAVERKEAPKIGPFVFKISTTGTAFVDGGTIRIGSAMNTYGTGKYGQLEYKAEDAEVIEWR